MAPQIDYGTVNQIALAEYFVKRYNLVGADAEYSKARPTLMALPRDTERLKEGDGFYETVKIAQGWSQSPDWVKGNAYHNVSKKIRWQVGDPYPQYGRLTFDNLALKRNNTGTLIDIKGSEADDVAKSMLDTCEFELWSDGSGLRGQISASGLGGTAAARVFTLAADTVYNFSYGMVLQFNTLASGLGSTRTDIYTVTDFDPIALTVSAARTTGAAGDVAASDFIFAVGSMGAYMPGIPTFIPAVAPSDVLYGVTRGANPALSGWRFPYVGSISETIQRAFAKMGKWVNKEGMKFNVCLSTNDWLLLDLERESKQNSGIQTDPGAMAKWGLEGIIVRTAFGPITCIGIPQVADGRGYIIDWTSWKFYTLDNLPHVINEDGLTFTRLGVNDPTGNTQNGDALAMQFRMWKMFLCRQPLSNATFPTVSP